MKPPRHEQIEIAIVEPKREDVTSLCHLLIQDFGYIYSALFGTDKKMTSSLLKPILKANGGRHTLGYKSFYIAHPKSTRKEIVGMLKLTSSAERRGKFISTLSIIRIVLLNLGLRGLFRTWRKWLVIRGVTPKMEANELHIVYIAVSDDARNRGVGKQLLEYAKGVAKKEGRQLISLCVREKNVEAQGFFLSQGFSVEKVVSDDKADDLLGQGASIRMTAKV